MPFGQNILNFIIFANHLWPDLCNILQSPDSPRQFARIRFFAQAICQPARKGPQRMKRRPSTNSSDSSLAWHSLYQAALFESDRAKIPNRIDAAERAILDRVKQLFRIEGDHIEEDQILDDALYALRALRNCVVPNVNAAA
jgi:hypothetical protein